MTLRGYVRAWWVSDPNVHPCPACGCPLQAPPRRAMTEAIAEHFEVVHPEVALAPIGGAS